MIEFFECFKSNKNDINDTLKEVKRSKTRMNKSVKKGHIFGGLMKKEKNILDTNNDLVKQSISLTAKKMMDEEQRIDDEIKGGFFNFINEKKHIVNKNKEQTESALKVYFQGYKGVEHKDRNIVYSVPTLNIHIAMRINPSELTCVFECPNYNKSKTYNFLHYTAEDIIRNIHKQICELLKIK